MASDEQQTDDEPRDHQETAQKDDRPTEKPTEDSPSGQLPDMPDVTDEHKDKAKEMGKAYRDELSTVTLPGSHATVAGTAVAEWEDEDGSKLVDKAAEDSDEPKKEFSLVADEKAQSGEGDGAAKGDQPPENDPTPRS